MRVATTGETAVAVDAATACRCSNSPDRAGTGRPASMVTPSLWVIEYRSGEAAGEAASALVADHHLRRGRK